MRYLGLIALVLMYPIVPAKADMCCPSNCVPDYNPNQCVAIATWNACGAAKVCGGTSSNTPSRSGSGNRTYQVQGPIIQCVRANTTRADIENETNACVAALSANAEFYGCLFEDDAGRAEDQRTGLSCPDREARLAKQCKKRCLSFAIEKVTPPCPRDETWQAVFGSIGGNYYGSARVELCGPPLPTSFFNRLKGLHR
jgi:hypothetical protein